MRHETVRSSARAFAIVGALFLLTDAIFHATGHAPLVEELSKVEMSEFFAGALPSVWLFMSWHWLAVAAAAITSAVLGRPPLRGLILFCAAFASVDALLLALLAGPLFPGTWVLILAAAFLVGAALRWKPLGA